MVEWAMSTPDSCDTSIFQLNQLFPDEASAELWFSRQRWPQGTRCPHCGLADVYETPNRKPQPYRCRDCGSYFSVRTGTVMGNSRLPLKTWIYAMYFLLANPKSISSFQLAKRLGVTQKPAWYLAHRIREVWKEEEPQHFDGPIEVDETYVGGIERNKHREDKLGEDHWSGKTPVMGMKDRATGQVSAVVLDYVSKEEAVEFIFSRVDEGTPIYTDDSAVYYMIQNRSSVAHSRGQYRDGDCWTNGIESFWAMLKRAHKGTFHSMSYKHLQRYVDELAVKQSTRDKSLLQRMEDTAKDMVGLSLTYKDLIAD
ncbi:MAG: IS1595 family transposase [Candidatus Dadabacteria bacterium]|nr:IS1595 family transposase [Candidatus Dadabacteria bacterium]